MLNLHGPIAFTVMVLAIALVAAPSADYTGRIILSASVGFTFGWLTTLAIRNWIVHRRTNRKEKHPHG